MCHYQCPCGSSEVYLDTDALVAIRGREHSLRHWGEISSKLLVKIEPGRLLRVWGEYEIDVHELATCKDCTHEAPIHEFMQPTNLGKDMGKEERSRWNQLRAGGMEEHERHCPAPGCNGVLCLMIDGEDMWWFCNDCKRDFSWETEGRKSDEPTNSTANEAPQNSS